MTRTDQASRGGGEARRERVLLSAAIVALGALLFAPALGGGPGHVDELRYAEVTRQMTEYGDLLVPHINGEVYSEKPPMFFWLSGLAHVVTGDRIAASRVVAALAVILAALLLVPLARIVLGSPAPGRLGAAVLLTSAMGISRVQAGVIDSLLVVFTTGAVVALLRAGPARGRARAGYTAGAALLLAAGVLTKGPVGLLCPLVGVVAVGLVAGGRRGVPVVPTVVATLAAGQAGWWYAERMLLSQSADRMVEATAHPEPFGYYFVSVLEHLLPWTLLLPGTVWLAVRRRATETGRGALALLAFAGVGVLLFSLFSAKRSGYVFPFYPPLALAVGWGIWRYGPVDRFFRSRWADRGPFVALAILPIGAGALLALYPAVAPFAPKLAPDRNVEDARRLADALGFTAGAAAVAGGLAAVLLGVAARRAIRTERFRRFGALAAAATGVLVAAAGVAVLPPLDPGREAREFGSFLVRIEDPARPFLLLGGHLDGRANFYTGARRYPTAPAAGLGAAMEEDPRRRVVVRDRIWRRVPEAERARFTEIDDGRPADREWRVFRLAP